MAKSSYQTYVEEFEKLQKQNIIRSSESMLGPRSFEEVKTKYKQALIQQWTLGDKLGPSGKKIDRGDVLANLSKKIAQKQAEFASPSQVKQFQRSVQREIAAERTKLKELTKAVQSATDNSTKSELEMRIEAKKAEIEKLSSFSKQKDIKTKLNKEEYFAYLKNKYPNIPRKQSPLYYEERNDDLDEDIA